MADQDLEIRVRTTADTTALDQVANKVRNLRSGALGGSGAIDDPSIRLRANYPQLFGPPEGPFGPEPPQGSGPFAALAAASVGSQGLFTGLSGAQRSAAEIEKNALGMSMNLARARNESIILARELATGVPSMRTLGSLLGSLGPHFALAAVEGLVVVEAIKKGTQQLLEFDKELSKQGELITKNAEKWRNMAENAFTPESMDKIVDQMSTAFDEVNAKVAEAQQKQLTTVQAGIQGIAAAANQLSIFAGIPRGLFDSEMFTKGVNQTKKAFEELKETQLDNQRTTLETAKILQDEFEADKLLPAQEAIDKITRSMEVIKSLRESLPDPFGQDIGTLKQYNDLLDADQKKLDALNKIGDQKKKAADDAADSADEQVKRVLLNEKAATEARQAGQGKDADMYQASADAFKNALNPAQQQQLANIKKLNEAAYGGPPKPVDDLTRNAQAFSAYWQNPDVQSAFAGQGSVGFMSAGAIGGKYSPPAPKQETTASEEEKWNEVLIELQKLNDKWQ